VTRGRPKTSSKTYAREKRLTDKYPTLPEMPGELRQEGPRTNAEERAWDAWVSTAKQAIRATCLRREGESEPYAVPEIALADVPLDQDRG